MLDPKKIFKNYCKNNSLRYTPERETIISEIYRKDGHFDIDNLYVRIRKQHPQKKIAKASVYRNIPHLIKAGLIRESFYDKGQSYYEHTLGHDHHDHIKCLKCGKIIEFYDDSIDKAQEMICKKHNFQMIWHAHILAGFCDKCTKSKVAQKKK